MIVRVREAFGGLLLLSMSLDRALGGPRQIARGDIVDGAAVAFPPIMQPQILFRRRTDDPFECFGIALGDLANRGGPVVLIFLGINDILKDDLIAHWLRHFADADNHEGRAVF